MGKNIEQIVDRFVYSYRKNKHWLQDLRREHEIGQAMDSRREMEQPKEQPEVTPVQINEEPTESKITPWEFIKVLAFLMRDFIEDTCLAGIISLPMAYVVELATGVDCTFICSGIGLFVASMTLASRFKRRIER